MRVRRATGKTLVLLCGPLSLVSCAKAPKQDVAQIPNVDELRKLNVENAVEDARKALKSGDPRVLGVYGLTIDIPGAPAALQEDPPLLRATYGIRMIEGTSDALISEEHEKLNDNAVRYAEKYNQTIFAERGRKLPAK
jgi:hypothetical protein